MQTKSDLWSKHIRGFGVEHRKIPISPILINRGKSWIDLLIPPFVPNVQK